MCRLIKCLLLASISVLLCSHSCFAQSFQVYTTKGDITVKSNKGLEKVLPGMALNASDIISIPIEGRVVILCEQDKRLYTIKNPATDKLEKLIQTEGNTTQQLTESYLQFVKQKITDSGKPMDKNYKQAAGTSYRDADSLLLKALVPEEKADTASVKNNENKK